MMGFNLCALLLASCLLCVAQSDKSAQLKVRRSSYFNEPAMAKQLVDAVALDESADKLSAAAAGSSSSGTGNKDASSGRLFMKKFLLFKNMFSSNNQPVIPIIITNAGTATGTSPTTTVTSTGTIPTATGTITTSPTTTGTTTTSNRQGQGQANVKNRQYMGEEEDESQYDGEDGAGDANAAAAELVDEQTLQAALAAGAQEYEVVTEDLQGTGSTESKASQPSRINLRRKGNRRGQMISVRIPPRYRRYFKNGQKVMLNTNNKPTKRRVIRKRVQNRRRVNNKNKNKNKKNKNKRTRIAAA